MLLDFFVCLFASVCVCALACLLFVRVLNCVTLLVLTNFYLMLDAVYFIVVAFTLLISLLLLLSSSSSSLLLLLFSVVC